MNNSHMFINSNEDLKKLLPFLQWLYSDQEDGYYSNLWKRLSNFLSPSYLFIRLDNHYLEDAFEISFGTIPSQVNIQIEAIFNQSTHSTPPLHKTQSKIFIDDTSLYYDTSTYIDHSFENITIFSIGRQNQVFDEDENHLIRLVFMAMVGKNQRIAYTQAEQQIITNLDERKTQYNFISAITHDLRNPLGCIKGYVTTLLRTDVQWAPDIQQQFLEVINTEADHLQDMISNLLETARLQSGNYELNYQKVNLQLLLDEISIYNKEKHPELSIHIQTMEKTPFILADQKKIHQAFQNLVDNALKHAKIFDIWFKIILEKDGFLVQCEDHGEGISEDRLKNIFERFSRTPEFSPGSHGVGLGLYISKEIIERHQGSITVKSHSGEGTTFSIFLPTAPTQETKK